MKRYDSHGSRDMQLATDGDAAFRGVNTKQAPWLLAEGIVQAAENMTFRDGRATTRKGLVQGVHFKTGTWITGGTAPVYYGSGLWSDPSGVEWLLVAEATKVWRLRAGVSPASFDLPVTLSDEVEIVQAFDKMLMFRGSAGGPIEWDGTGDWLAVSQGVNPPTRPIPNGSDVRGLKPALMNGRLIVPYGRTSVAISDLYDYTAYDAVFNDYNLTTGNDDTITALVPFANAQLAVFKTQSVAMLDQLTGDLSALSLQTLNNTIGTIAGRSVAQLGGDLLFANHRGVFRLTQVLDTRITTPPVPISEPVEKYVRRLNGSKAHLMCAATAGDTYYLALPIDNATRCNAILAYDAALDTWQGVHTFPTGVAFDDLLVTDDINGNHVLYAVDYAGGRVMQMYAGDYDTFATFGGGIPVTAEHQISTSLTTRAYTFNNAGSHKDIRSGQATWEVWNAAPTLSVKLEGVGDTSSRLSPTYSRSVSRIHAVVSDSTLARGGHGAMGREDYSVSFPATGSATNGTYLHNTAGRTSLSIIYVITATATGYDITAGPSASVPTAVPGDFVISSSGVALPGTVFPVVLTAVTPITSGLYNGYTKYSVAGGWYGSVSNTLYLAPISSNNLIDFDLFQTHNERVSVKARSRHAALKVTNARGRIALAACELSAHEADRATRRTP